MPQILTWENGEQVIREALPEELPVKPTDADLDAKAEEVATQVLDQNRDAMRAMGETLAEVIFRVSNGTVPQNVTQEQARTWVRDTFYAKYRELL